MSAFSPRDLLNADRWSNLFFTTYALSLSFFEAVVLDAMLRQRIDEAIILADESGVRSAMSEIGAQAVGRAYDLEPIAVQGGCFHAKFSCVSSDSDAHIMVGSGNLTFGGWGSNAECIEHLHPSFAADAFRDAADFLRAIARSPRLRHAAGDTCLELGATLERNAARYPQNGQIRLIHNIGRSISNQLAAYAQELGGARSLSIASPFFDHTGVSNLCSQLGLGSARLHVHNRGTVLSSGGTNWPTGESGALAEAVSLEIFRDDNRLLHAKLYEIICPKGRIVVSGSSNATYAGLEADRNVELCVVRIQREKVIGWRFVSATPPVREIAAHEDYILEPEAVAVLRASLAGSRIAGRIVSAFPAGDVSLFKKSSLRWDRLGSTSVNETGSFEFEFKEGWKLVSTGQFLLRLEHANGVRAQGFVALPELRDIARRIGAPSVHFFSLLQNKETPADVAAILDFIYTHPDWLPKRDLSGGGKPSSTCEAPPQMIDLDALAKTEQTGVAKDPYTPNSWTYEARFMSQVFAALSERRGSLDATTSNQQTDDKDNADIPSDGAVDKAEQDTTLALASFERLLSLLLSGRSQKQQPIRAAQIAQYVVERLQVESGKVSSYLDQLVRTFARSNIEADEEKFAQAVMLLWGGHLYLMEDQKASILRRQLLRVFGSIPSSPPTLELAGGFQERLGASTNLESLWWRASELETIQEEIRRFWTDEHQELSRDAYPLLGALPEWPVLQDGRSKRVLLMKQVADYCPDCHLGFSSVNAARIRTVGVVTCRGKVLLCEEF